MRRVLAFVTVSIFSLAIVRGAETLGSGDALIHIIPSLSSPSVKNGGKITVSAVVKAPLGVHSVTADMGGIETLVLSPSSAQFGGVNADSTLGLWSAEWKGHDLQERVYDVTLTVSDRSGHEFQDHSLKFSDPAAGNSTPGTANYPGGGLKRLNGLRFQINEDQVSAAVIDTANGYAYFGTGTYVDPGAVVKVAYGSGTTAPVEVGTATLNVGESNLTCAVIDSARGYAYFGTSNGMNQSDYVVKISLGAGAAAPSRVGSLALNSGEFNLGCAVIDPTAGTNGFAYFGTSSGIIAKVDLGAGNALPTEVTSITLNANEYALSAAVIDPANGFAYFATNNAPSIIIKVGLNPFQRVAALTLNSGTFEYFAGCAVIDTVNGFAYFGMVEHPGIVVKIKLSDFTRVGELTVAGQGGQMNYFNCAAFDQAKGYIYFGAQNGYVVRVGVNGTGVPTEINSTQFSGSLSQPFAAVLDPSNGTLLFGLQSRPSIIKKFNVSNAAVAPVEGSNLTLQTGEAIADVCLLDVANQYAYVGTDSTPGHVIKISLAGPAPVRVADLTLSNFGEDSLTCGVIDPANGVALFGASTSIVKVNLGTGANPPTRVGAVTLANTEYPPQCAVIDTANQYAYFGGYTVPGCVVKIALNAPAAAPTKVGTATFSTGENYAFGGTIDVADQTAYFCTFTTPGRIVKVALNGNTAPTRAVALTLAAGEDNPSCAAIDTVNHCAYFGLQSPGKIVKVLLNNFTEVTPTLTLNTGEDYVEALAVDAPSSSLLFVLGTTPGQVGRAALNGVATPQRLGLTPLLPSDGASGSMVLDGAGKAYLAMGTTPGGLVQVAYANNGSIKASKITLAENGLLNDVRFYSYAATGNVSLAIYDNSAPKKLLWSGSAVNNPVNGIVDIPISAGTPNLLTLTAGTYWLAFQVDTTANVPSYVGGNPGDGFSLTQSYGAFPASISGETSTAETWTEYLTYDKVQFTLSATSPQKAGSPANLTLTAVNQDGATVTRYAGAKSVTFTGANPSPGPLTAPMANGVAFGIPSSVTLVAGVASVPLVLYKAETAALAATDGFASTATPATVVVNASDPAILSFSVQPASGVAKQPFPTQPAVLATDAYGNLLAGQSPTVTLAIQNNAGPGGTLSGTATLPADPVTSVATFSGLSIDTAGTGYTLAASIGAVQVVSAPFDLATTPVVLAPIPTATPNPGVLGQAITFAATASGGSGPLMYAWDFGDGAKGTGASVQHAYGTLGTFTATLTVTDAAAGKATATLMIPVFGPVVMTAAPTASPNPAAIGQNVTFTGSATGGNGGALTYTWDFGDKTSAKGPSVTHAYATSGSFPATLTVTDTASGTANASVTEVILPAGTPLPQTPLAFGSAPAALPNPGIVGQPIVFSGSASGGSGPLTYAWDFGDGIPGTGASTVHVYAQAGTYAVVLTVSDGKTQIVSAPLSETVSPAVSVVGFGPDSDGDGFSDSFETAVSSDPKDPTKTPTGQPITPNTLQLLTLTKLTIKLNFDPKKTKADTITLGGTLNVPAAFDAGHAVVDIDVGGITKSFALSKKGSAKQGSDSFGLTLKAVKGIVQANAKAKFTASFTKGSFATTLSGTSQLDNANVKGSKTVVVSIVFNTTVLQKPQVVKYTAKANKSGSAQ